MLGLLVVVASLVCTVTLLLCTEVTMFQSLLIGAIALAGLIERQLR